MSAPADDERWMAEALAVAREGMDAGELPIGAVVVVDGEVSGRAHTEERRQGRFVVHADLLALDRADRVLGRRRRRATLYVTLEPCLMCLGAAMAAMVGTVVWALESPSDGAACIVEDFEARRRREASPGYEMPVLRAGVGRAEAASLFREYLAAPGPDDAYRRWARLLLESVGEPTGAP